MKVFFTLSLFLFGCPAEAPLPPEEPETAIVFGRICDPVSSECAQIDAFTWDCTGTNICDAYPGMTSIAIFVTCAP